MSSQSSSLDKLLHCLTGLLEDENNVFGEKVTVGLFDTGNIDCGHLFHNDCEIHHPASARFGKRRIRVIAITALILVRICVLDFIKHAIMKVICSRYFLCLRNAYIGGVRVQNTELGSQLK